MLVALPIGTQSFGRFTHKSLAVPVDIPGRTISMRVSETELAKRRAEQDAKGWKPAAPRKRNVTTALKAYAAFASSADRGAVRDLKGIE